MGTAGTGTWSEVEGVHSMLGYAVDGTGSCPVALHPTLGGPPMLHACCQYYSWVVQLDRALKPVSPWACKGQSCVLLATAWLAKALDGHSCNPQGAISHVLTMPSVLNACNAG